MRIKRIIVISIFSMLAVLPLAQASDSEGPEEPAGKEANEPAYFGKEKPAKPSETVPFNIGLIPYVDMNTYMAKEPLNHLTIDLLVGYTNSVTGMAIAGGASVIRNDLLGAQVAMGVNVAERKMTGIQIGAVNVGGDVYGAQIGLINVAKRAKGATIGLFNVVLEGKHSLDIWTSDIAIFNVGTKLGTDRVYSIVSFSWQPKLNPQYENCENRWGPGIGIGINFFNIKGGGLALESVTHLMFGEDPNTKPSGIKLWDPGGWKWSFLPNMITSIRLVGSYRINETLSIFAGPTINANIGVVALHVISYLGEDAWFYDIGTPPGQIGVGFVAGVELF